jgi:3-oxoacyl-[acyl-carrier protein] reductase
MPSAARNVLVTGGSRGLGLATAKRLAADGFRVIAVARHLTDELAAASEAVTGRLCFWPYDLSDTGGLDVFVKAVRREFGPLYGLVNNAGAGSADLLATLPPATIERLIRLNTLSPIMLTRAVLRTMLVDRKEHREGGRFINIASIVAATGFRGLSVYAATKASLVGFTRSLAREVGPFGITANAVSPGFVDTAMTEDMQATDRASVVRRSPLCRLAEARDVADAVGFLMSEHAGGITGTVLTVDAGTTA